MKVMAVPLILVRYGTKVKYSDAFIPAEHHFSPLDNQEICACAISFRLHNKPKTYHLVEKIGKPKDQVYSAWDVAEGEIVYIKFQDGV